MADLGDSIIRGFLKVLGGNIYGSLIEPETTLAVDAVDIDFNNGTRQIVTFGGSAHVMTYSNFPVGDSGSVTLIIKLSSTVALTGIDFATSGIANGPVDLTGLTDTGTAKLQIDWMDGEIWVHVVEVI